MTYCKKCLLSEIDKEEYFKNIYEYIAALSEDVKVDDMEYNRRLNLCKECEDLVNGMCKKCGCFVELRAAKRLMNCPSEKKIW